MALGDEVGLKAAQVADGTAKTLATAAADAVQAVAVDAADAVSCIVGAIDRLTAMGREQSDAWRNQAAEFAEQTRRLVDWVTGFDADIHITNKKEKTQ